MAVGREVPGAQTELFDARSSASAKYARLVVGRPGLGALIKHECVVLFAQWIPGALGLVLRRALYRLVLGACGRNVVFGQNVVLRHPHKIRIADNVVIDDNCLLDAKGESNYAYIVGGDHDLSDPTIPILEQRRVSAGVQVGSGAWIGAGVRVLDGVAIGDGAVIGANAVVREPVPAGAIAAGVPARVISMRDGRAPR